MEFLELIKLRMQFQACASRPAMLAWEMSRAGWAGEAGFLSRLSWPPACLAEGGPIPPL